MNRRLLLVLTALWLILFLGMDSSMAIAQTGDVTFRVNMSIKMREASFQPQSGDIVTVPGSFNGWSTSADTLRDLDGDSIYTKLITIPVGTINYKFWKTLRGGIDWEGDPNRTYDVVAGPQTLPVVWFDRDSVYTPPVNVPVTFQVNMRVKIIEQSFQPQSGDVVTAPGSFNGWNTTADTLRDLDGDSIYTKTISLLEASSHQYKFFKTLRAGLDWEGDPNRQHVVPTGGGSIPVVYFNRDSIANPPVSGNILWKSNLNSFLQLGWFRPDLGDSMEVRGSFNSWGGTKMDDPFGTGVYEVSLPFQGNAGDMLPYKFFVDFDSAGATQRFPGYVHSGGSSTRDGFAYEHPAELGDGNRQFELTQSGNLTPPQYWFSSINPNGLLLAATDTVRVTLRVNMGPATRYLDPFNPATDTAKLVWPGDHWLWRSSQMANQGSFAETWILTRSGPTDSIYTVSFRVKGPTHYGMMYFYRYTHPDNSNVDEGGGLGAGYKWRSRFIQPSGPNAFPTTYTAPVDQWQKNPPMPAEAPPFPVLGVFEQPGLSQPLAYKLFQNYPNPFNPATRIVYTIPERAHVTLKIYNVLGQEVLTLMNGEQNAGNYVALFEANSLASGVYFYRLQAGSFSEVKKMVLMK